MMDVVASLTIGLLVSCGFYLILDGRLQRVVLGVLLITHSANLLLILMGRRPSCAPPILGSGADCHQDPLPQALILTAIVIGMGMAAFILMLARRLREAGVETTDDAPHVPEDAP